MLSEVGEELLSIYGQHEHQSLQWVETHVDILDEFGGLLGLRQEFQNILRNLLPCPERFKESVREREKGEGI